MGKSDKQSDWPEIRKRWKDAGRLLSEIADLAGTGAADLDLIRRAVEKLGDVSVFGRGVEQLRQQTVEFLDEEQARQRSRFGAVVREWVQRRKTESAAVRELDNAWRVDCLEVQLEPESLRARVRYNREVVAEWTKISRVEDLVKLENSAMSDLKKVVLADDELIDVFWSAFQAVTATDDAPAGQAPSRAGINSFARGFRLEIANRDMSGSNPYGRFRFPELKKWGFLYNLDRYMTLGSRPGAKRLAFETGSQREHASGRSVVIGGLDPQSGYREICWVRRAQG